MLPLIKIILTLLPLLQRRVLLNFLSVRERVILLSNVLTKGLWLCWVMGISLVHLLLALLVLLVRVKVNVMYLEGYLLIVKRLMRSVCKDRDETQRENIFHTRCVVMGKICFLIIDGG